MQIVIPAAGAGSRFKEYTQVPKPYIDVNGKPMIVSAVESLDIRGVYTYILPKHDLTESVKKQLLELTPVAIFIEIDYITEGAVETAMLAQKHLISDKELIIVNCDQIMNWDSADALEKLRGSDASVITIEDYSTKHSYVEVQDNRIVRFNEKETVTGIALTGIHYWKQAELFTQSAQQMIVENNRTKNEFYVSTTYNYLLSQNVSVSYVNIPATQIQFVGIPTDLEAYLNDSKKNG